MLTKITTDGMQIYTQRAMLRHVVNLWLIAIIAIIAIIAVIAAIAVSAIIAVIAVIVVIAIIAMIVVIAVIAMIVVIAIIAVSAIIAVIAITMKQIPKDMLRQKSEVEKIIPQYTGLMITCKWYVAVSVAMLMSGKQKLKKRINTTKSI